MAYALALSECLLLIVMVRNRRYLITPAFFLLIFFSIGSALTYDPYDSGFTAQMADYSDIIKAGALAECFLLISDHLDLTDRALSAAISICAAGLVTASVRVPSSPHTLRMVWMAAFALTMQWWNWRRGDMIPKWICRHGWLLSAYLVSKSVGVIAGHFGLTKETWLWTNRGAEICIVILILLWVKTGPQRTGDREHEILKESGNKH